MSEREEMEVFLREMLMNIESEQSQIIRKLEDCHRNIESLNREKIILVFLIQVVEKTGKN